MGRGEAVGLGTKTQPPLIGVDISSTAVKLLQLARTGDRYRVEHYAVEPLPPNAVLEKNLVEVEAVGEAIRRAVARSGSRVKHAAAAVSGSSVITKVITMPAAYALSRKDFKARNGVMFYFVFTMFFSGGLVPTYMTVSALHLISTKTILIVFVAINTYNLIIARTFIQNSIPDDLYEAAVLDGCSHFTYFMKVVLPLSKAVISVLILYYAVFHWNDYFNALIYNSKQDNAPLQIVLRDILLLNQAFASGNGGVQGGYGQSSADQVKYAVIIVSTLPILCVYPFIQKYFEKGVMIGAVKG